MDTWIYSFLRLPFLILLQLSARKGLLISHKRQKDYKYSKGHVCNHFQVVVERGDDRLNARALKVAGGVPLKKNKIVILVKNQRGGQNAMSREVVQLLHEIVGCDQGIRRICSCRNLCKKNKSSLLSVDNIDC